MEQAVLDNIPPQSLEAEQAVLGSMMIDANALADGVEMLIAADFYRPTHSEIFDALKTLMLCNAPADLITLQEELRKREKLEEIGGTEYLMALVEAVPTAANVEHYAKIVKAKSVKRNVIASCVKLIGLAKDEECSDIEQCFIKEALSHEGKSRGTIVGISDVMNQCVDKLEAYQRGERDFAIPFGIKSLDRLVDGTAMHDVVVIGGRPSEGKSVLAVMSATEAGKLVIPTLVFSQEMSARSLGMRMLSSDARFDLREARKGKLQDEEWDRIVRSAGEYSNMPVTIVDECVSLTQLESIARRWILKTIKPNGMGLIIIDYLQIIEYDKDASKKTRNDVVQDIMRRVKSLARNNPVGIDILAQLNRANKKESRDPTMADLRESGAIEADADKVLLLANPNTEPCDEYGRRQCKIIDAKYREGATGEVNLWYVPKYVRFDDMNAGDITNEPPPRSSNEEAKRWDLQY